MEAKRALCHNENPERRRFSLVEREIARENVPSLMNSRFWTQRTPGDTPDSRRVMRDSSHGRPLPHGFRHERPACAPGLPSRRAFRGVALTILSPPRGGPLPRPGDFDQPQAFRQTRRAACEIALRTPGSPARIHVPPAAVLPSTPSARPETSPTRGSAATVPRQAPLLPAPPRCVHTSDARTFQTPR